MKSKMLFVLVVVLVALILVPAAVVAQPQKIACAPGALVGLPFDFVCQISKGATAGCDDDPTTTTLTCVGIKGFQGGIYCNVGYENGPDTSQPGLSPDDTFVSLQCFNRHNKPVGPPGARP